VYKISALRKVKSINSKQVENSISKISNVEINSEKTQSP